MPKRPQVTQRTEAWLEWKREQLKRKVRPRLKRKKPAPPTPPQRIAPTPAPPRFKKPKIAPRIKPRIKPKKRDRFQVAGLLRKGGTVKRKIPRRRYKKGGVAKKHLRC